jgi:hypothetical protein
MSRELPSHVVVEFVTPGGVACREFADGAVVMRVCVGHVTADDGLLKEMASGREPVPWMGRAERDEAVAAIRAASGIGEEERAALLAHVASTPYYDA